MNRAIRSATAMLFLGAFALPGAAAFAGVTRPAFYVDGELYRTVGTPADLPAGPPQSHDVIYALDAF